VKLFVFVEVFDIVYSLRPVCWVHWDWLSWLLCRCEYDILQQYDNV